MGSRESKSETRTSTTYEEQVATANGILYMAPVGVKWPIDSKSNQSFQNIFVSCFWFEFFIKTLFRLAQYPAMLDGTMSAFRFWYHCQN